MSPLANRLLRRLLGAVKAQLKKSATLQAMVYDQQNRETFSGLEWHEKMLADRVRVHSYREAIGHAVKPGDTVIDLGTGSGILAMFAARAGAKRVYAIDHSSFIGVAVEIGRANGFEQITFVQANSRDFVCPERVDLIVHEQMGHTLFGENMIANLLDLKRRALKPGGRILPAHFELFAAPVSLKEEYRRPFIWQIEETGLDLSFLQESPSIDPYVAADHRCRLLKGFEVASFLAEPKAIITFDMNRLDAEDGIAQPQAVAWKILEDGVVDGVCFYFRVRFEDGTSFDTSPFSTQTSWENLLLRTDLAPVSAGTEWTRLLQLNPLTQWARWRVVEEVPA